MTGVQTCALPISEAVQLSRRAHQQVQEAVSEARSEIDRLLNEFRSVESPGKAVHAARTRLTDLERQAEAALADLPEADSAPGVLGAEPIRRGQQVRIKGLDQLGTVSGEPTAAGLVEVQLPLGKVRLPLEAVVPEGGPGQREAISSVQVARAREETAAELNLIGYDAEEAARRLDRYVGDAFLAGFPTVRIVHGKGAGILRRTVAELLQGHPLVMSFRLADYRDGGIGATIVELHSHGVLPSGAG